jgi:hypothetical protein
LSRPGHFGLAEEARARFLQIVFLEFLRERDRL